MGARYEPGLMEEPGPGPLSPSAPCSGAGAPGLPTPSAVIAEVFQEADKAASACEENKANRVRMAELSFQPPLRGAEPAPSPARVQKGPLLKLLWWHPFLKVPGSGNPSVSRQFGIRQSQQEVLSVAWL